MNSLVKRMLGAALHGAISALFGEEPPKSAPKSTDDLIREVGERLEQEERGRKEVADALATIARESERRGEVAQKATKDPAQTS